MCPIRIACQTYTWEMLEDEWQGTILDIMDWIADAGYDGIETDEIMMGDLFDRPEEFAFELKSRNLKLAALAYSTTGFTDPNCLKEDLAGARSNIGFLSHFQNPILGLGGATSLEQGNERAHLDRAIAFYNKVGGIGAEAGIKVTIHPHSHSGSLLLSADEYAYLMQHLDLQYVSLGPDTGHIGNGGQDLLTCLRTHLPNIIHIHFKDVTATGEWAMMGQGVCDFQGALQMLESSGYNGWVVAEEESEEARLDGRAAIRKNREYLHSLGY